MHMHAITRDDMQRIKTAARELLGEWAELLRLALDETRAVVTP